LSGGAGEFLLTGQKLWGMTNFDRNQVKSLLVLSPGETASARHTPYIP